jgi:hypothetical protein
LRTIGGITKTKYKHAYGLNPKFATHLRTWGEAGTVKTKVTGTLIGYAKDHEGDCYYMWNPLTNGVHTTCDIIWLKRMYYAKDIGFNLTVEPEILDEVLPVVRASAAGVQPNGDDVVDVSVNDITIRIDMILMIMATWVGELLDVKGAFLHRQFGEREKALHMFIPQGMEQYYPLNWILKLLKTIYGLCHSAYAFWRMLLAVFRLMGFERSKVDPCLYYNWTRNGLVLWVAWVNDCLVVGTKEAVAIAKKQLTSKFDCDEIGNMDKYAECKVDCNFDNKLIKLTQPMMLQSFVDEFPMCLEGRASYTPATPGEHLVKGDNGTNVSRRCKLTTERESASSCT